jgi:hypothetical protein
LTPSCNTSTPAHNRKKERKKESAGWDFEGQAVALLMAMMQSVVRRFPNSLDRTWKNPWQDMRV